MYVTLRDRPHLAPSKGRRARVAAPVVLLGITSMFTDISSEMVAAILPLFVTVGLGLSPLAFGVVDGLYQGISAVTRLAGGYVADRTRRPKAVATTSYALSAASKLALLPVGSLPTLSSVVAVDRTGKGIRTAPRDALIAGVSPTGALGHAFGVHRALDTTGAMIGPLLAFALLALLPGNFDAVFVVSFCFAVLGVAVIALLVREQPLYTVTDRGPRGRDVARLLRQPAIRRVLLTAGLLSLASVSDGFLYLALQDREGLPAAVFPLLFVGTAVVCMSLAVPLGRLADRIGRVRVFLGGQLFLAGAYGKVAAAPLDDPRGARVLTDTSCERVTSNGDAGVCLSADRGILTTYAADVLGPDLQPVEQLAINGGGSRTRITDDSRLAATTTFVSGHSYNQAGFSTETLVHDLTTAESVNLEDFVTILDGKETTAVDRNVWGVTFAAGDTFYATVATGGSTWLVEGDLSERVLTSVRANAECPSLSPGGSRVAYKKRADGGTWRLHVLDLASGQEHAVAETRSVDDQVEWLDDTSLLYALPRAGSATADVWVVPADGGEPEVLIPAASSPSVVR
jgi:MFS family permease